MGKKKIILWCFAIDCKAQAIMIEGEGWPKGWSLFPKEKPKDRKEVQTFCPKHYIGD